MRPPHLDARALARLIAFALLLAACTSEATTDPDVPVVPTRTRAPIELSSPAFAEGGAIPVRFTCDGDGISPPLRWGEPPEGTVELALIVDDPDAPGDPFTHWVLFGVHPAVRSLEPGSAVEGAKQALNGFGRAAWGGPCPPGGDDAHRYFFTLLALERETHLPDGAGDQQVRDAIEPYVIGQGQLMGTYARASG